MKSPADYTNKEWVDFINNPDPKAAYWLGGRDTIAGLLAENYKKTKMPELAHFYKDNYEQHFSHEWHVSPQEEVSSEQA